MIEVSHNKVWFITGSQHLYDFAEMAGIECLIIDGDTDLKAFKRELRQNHLFYSIARGIKPPKAAKPQPNRD